MTMPTPNDMGEAPAWANYIVAQAVQASLGSIPLHALAVGVTISEDRVSFLFQLSEKADEDEEDMLEVIDAFEMLIGWVVPVSSSWQILEQPSIGSSPGSTRWVYLKPIS